jgi:hypothetical protein
MKNIGQLMWWGSGIILWFFMMSSFYGWWDIWGVIAAFLLAPGVILFPIIYWVKEGVFPVMYFVIWFIGVLGIFFSVDSHKK